MDEYSRAKIKTLDALFYHPIAELHLRTGRFIFVERYKIADPFLLMQDDEVSLFNARFLTGNEGICLPHTQ